MKSFLCDLILSCTLALQPGAPVADLTYGTVLYAYYQDDYQQALLEALIAERLDRRGDDPVRFELAKGSFAFADGMYQYAERTFGALDASQMSQLDRMRLDFHLARERFRRQDFDRVGGSLADVDLGKTWLGRGRFHPEVEFMRAELAAQRGDFDAADLAIERIDETSQFRAYALFNLGVALRSAGELARAEQTFSRLAAAPAYDAEALDLKQRAQLALAFVKRERSQVASAESVLGALPVAGRYRDLALTSYGGLAMDSGDYELAARIWMSLQNEDYWTESTATARLAFPMSLEQMASGELALIEYRAAERSFEARLDELTNLSLQADDPAWVGGLLQVFATPDRDVVEMNGVVERWRAELGHTDWLQWLSTERVHELLLEWHELQGVSEWLSGLPEELEVFDSLAQEQRRRAREARHLIETDGLLQRRGDLADTIDRQQQDLAHLRQLAPVRDATWMFRIADPQQLELLTDLARKRALLERLPATEHAASRSRLERIEGLVFWELVDQSSARMRALEKSANEHLAALAEIDASLVRVRSAEADLIAGVETDFLTFQDRADRITRQVAVAVAQREAMLGAEVKAGMAREMQQLQHHLLVTRIAIARATDQLAAETDADSDPLDDPLDDPLAQGES